MIGKWQRWNSDGQRSAYLTLPHGVLVYIVPTRATVSATRLWEVTVMTGGCACLRPMTRRFVCVKWKAVRQVIREELEAIGAAA